MFSTFTSSPEIPLNSSKSVRMQHLASLLLTFSQHFQLTIQRFKERQNTLFRVLVFKNFLVAQTLRTSFKIASEVRMHHQSSMILKLSQQFQIPKHRFKQHQTATRFPPCFQSFLGSPDRGLTPNIKIYLSNWTIA